MKKTLVALAALASVSVFAQSTSTISGSISVGLQDNGATAQGLAASSLGGGANAININTNEDLGGGNAAGFDAQIRFSAGTGDVASAGNGNALFHNANAYVSSAKLGTLRAGKIAEDTMCAFDPWGCTGGASMIAGESVAGQGATIGANGNGLVGAQSVNSGAGYKTPTIMGFSANFVSGVVGQTTQHERKLATYTYVNGPLTVQYLSTKGSANAAGNGALGAALNASPLINGTAVRAAALGASYNFGPATLMASRHITKDVNGINTFRITTLAASAPVTPTITLLAGYSKDSLKADNADTKKSVGVNYALSKRTTLGADLYNQEEFKSNGYVLRMKHTF